MIKIAALHIHRHTRSSPDQNRNMSVDNTNICRNKDHCGTPLFSALLEGSLVKVTLRDCLVPIEEIKNNKMKWSDNLNNVFVITHS